jgi:hypothetical protein
MLRVKGERIVSKSTWTGAGVTGDWFDPDNWSPSGVPDASTDVVIDLIQIGQNPSVTSSMGTVNSITDSGTLTFASAGTNNTVASFMDNTVYLSVDPSGGRGGTVLNIGGILTNSGDLFIGNDTLSAPDEVTAAALDNAHANTYEPLIRLIGSSVNQALLDVGSAAGFGAAGVLSGHVELEGDSAIEFASGEITSLAAGAALTLKGNEAFAEDSTALGSNSALTGLASVRGSLHLARTHSSSSRRRNSTPRSAVSGPAIQSMRRTFSGWKRRSISRKVRRARAERSPYTTRSTA